MRWRATGAALQGGSCWRWARLLIAPVAHSGSDAAPARQRSGFESQTGGLALCRHTEGNP